MEEDVNPANLLLTSLVIGILTLPKHMKHLIDQSSLFLKENSSKLLF